MMQMLLLWHTFYWCSDTACLFCVVVIIAFVDQVTAVL